MDVIKTFSGYGWILVPIGLFLGLLGYRIYRISLFLVGVLAGLAISAWIVSETGNNLLYLILGLGIGVIVGFIPYFLIKFSFFVLGMVGGSVLSSFVIGQSGLELESIGELILILTSAFVGGVLTVLMHKRLIIVFTSIVGTALIYQATIHYFPLNSNNWSWILYLIPLSLFIFVQMSGRKHHPDPVERNRRLRNR